MKAHCSTRDGVPGAECNNTGSRAGAWAVRTSPTVPKRGKWGLAVVARVRHSPVITRQVRSGEAQSRSTQEISPQVRVQVWISRAHDQDRVWLQCNGNCSSGRGQTVELQLKAAPERKESAFAEAFLQTYLGPLCPRPPKEGGWPLAALSSSWP